MTTRSQFWLATLVSAAVLLLSVVNIAIVHGNRSMDASIRERQTQVSDALTVNRLNQDLVQALAMNAVNNKDSEMRKLLESQNISITEGESSAAGASKSSVPATPAAQ
jgi:hypothetical protein